MSEGGDKIDPTRMCIPGTTFIPIAGIERFTIYEKMLHINWTLSECAIVHVPDPSEVEAQEKSSAPYTRINLNADTAHLGNDTKKNLGVCVWTSDGEEVIEDDNNKKVDSKEPIDEMRKSKRGRVVA
jgi:hypothetical protein